MPGDGIPNGSILVLLPRHENISQGQQGGGRRAEFNHIFFDLTVKDSIERFKESTLYLRLVQCPISLSNDFIPTGQRFFFLLLKEKKKKPSQN